MGEGPEFLPQRKVHQICGRIIIVSNIPANTSFSADDDYMGLFIHKGGQKDKPIVIAAIERDIQGLYGSTGDKEADARRYAALNGCEYIPREFCCPTTISIEGNMISDTDNTNYPMLGLYCTDLIDPQKNTINYEAPEN